MLYGFITLVFCLLTGVIIWMYTQIRSLRRQHKTRCEADQRHTASTLSEDSIRYKLDPHLLKNALNTIQSHAYQSYYALDKLSNVLDFILYESDLKWVKLKDEIAFAQNLIEINRLKLSPLFDLHVRSRIPKEAEELLIPRFISINSIENAFKHADLQQDDSFISIIFEITGDQFVLTVSNKIASFPPQTSKSGGLGNETFRTRLQQIYGDNHRYTVDKKDNTYTATLSFQLHKYD